MMFGRKHTEDEEMEAMTRSYLKSKLGITSAAPAAQQSEMDAWAEEQRLGWTWKPHTRPTFPEIEGLND
jgi:hypothetical protein